jgi:hypothetical protein
MPPRRPFVSRIAPYVVGATCLATGVTAAFTGYRAIAIAFCGLPTIAGAAILALNYGQRNSYS